jgi:DNA topoisomerase-2
MDLAKKYKKLSDIDHVLMKSGMWIGSTKKREDEVFVMKGKKPVKITAVYNPGFIKIFDEIISNSADEHKRNTKLNQIKVEVNQETGTISVYDNGGIPVEKHPEYKEWIPELIFSNLKAGSNFDEEEQRVVAGTNGVGSTLTNIFSLNFKVETCDGTNKFVQEFSNNMRERTKPKITKHTKGFTKITWNTDFSKFKMKGIDDTTFELLKKRTIDVAACNPKLKVYFNGELYQYKGFQDYCSLYTDTLFYEESKDWQIGIGLSPTGDMEHVSFANSVHTKDGGTHVDYIASQLADSLRELINKKHKVDIKPAEIKKHLFLFINATIINSDFNSQTKEKLINSPKDFGTEHTVSESLVKRLFKSDIIETILDWIDKKKLAQERAELRKLNKNLAKTKVLDLVDAKARSNRERCVLGIFEGKSALNPVRRYRDSQLFGAFPLRGKFRNVNELKNSQVVKNKEIIHLLAALRLKLGESPDSMRYGKIYIYTDADPDGDSIAALLINFFAKYWPELFDRGKIYKVLTPLVVSKRGKTKNYFYTNEDYQAWLKTVNPKGWEIDYKKGLASLEDDEYEEIVNNPQLLQIKKDPNAKESLTAWFGDDSNLRKERLLSEEDFEKLNITPKSKSSKTRTTSKVTKKENNNHSTTVSKKTAKALF